MNRIRNANSQNSTRKISKAQITRSVASSSAIETDADTSVIERRLKSGKRKFPNLHLAS